MINHPKRTEKAQAKKVAQAIDIAHDHDHDYSELLICVQEAFNAATEDNPTLFTTDAEGLWELYLDSLPAERQVHNCHCCKRFIEQYGGLVTIDDEGQTTPVLWSYMPAAPFYEQLFRNLGIAVSRARVTGVFLTKKTTWGTPVTGKWSHMSVVPGMWVVYREGALTAGQAMAVKKEDFRTVSRALAEFSTEALVQAKRILDADALSRSEKFLGPVEWLLKLQDRPKGRKGENVLWKAIAQAPAGYCHPRSSVIGGLLEDIESGRAFEDIRARFNAKLHPLAYQRPQAAPSAATIKQAEALVEKLGIARSLERRFARLDEVKLIWEPKAALKQEQQTAGVFATVKAKEAIPKVSLIDLPAQIMTWFKFERTVLPDAEKIELFAPYNGNYEAFLGSLHADAPGIFKWDNPYSVYVYHGGSLASNWNLSGKRWVPVVGISPRPNEWGKKQEYLGGGLLLILEDCIDLRLNQGNALFPETLKAELHGVRSVIEAYSKTAAITRGDGPYACGLGINKNATNCHLKVFANGGWQEYKIDRWD